MGAGGLGARIGGQVLVLDGGVGTELLARAPGSEGVRAGAGPAAPLDLWNATRPELVHAVHAAFLAAGCDAVTTNTFQGTRATLAEHGLAERARELSLAGARIARQAADEHATRDRPRWVLGSMGPGRALPSLGEARSEELLPAYAEQAAALAEGGVDGFLIETCRDPLQARAAIAGALEARRACGRELPLLVSFTVEPSGRLRAGTELEAMVAMLDALPVDLIAINCSAGPREMAAPVRALARSTEKPAGAYPNAGLPRLEGGRPRHPVTPDELADWLERFVEEDGIELVGGCCGTTPAHIASVVERLAGRAPRPRRG